MARVTVNYGGDSITRDLSHTNDILSNSALAEVMGFNSDRVEVSVNGAIYSGALREGDVVTLTTKANTKG